MHSLTCMSSRVLVNVSQTLFELGHEHIGAIVWTATIADFGAYLVSFCALRSPSLPISLEGRLRVSGV